jgi:Predicted ATPase or kinase
VNAAGSKHISRAQADPSAIDIVSHSSLHTERLGERIAAHAEPGDVIALWGELGTGKTVFARGIAIGLGIDEDTVTSPTFVILHEHFGGRCRSITSISTGSSKVSSARPGGRRRSIPAESP